MTGTACTSDSQELLAYWLACSERLGKLVELGGAIRAETLRGDFGFVASTAFVARMKASGLRLREYTLEPGGSVSCTITPADDFVISHLRAPLQGVRRLDVLIDDSTLGKLRIDDVAFDAAADGLVMVPSAAFLRSLGIARQRVQLVAVEGANERVIADYTFNHSPS
jgi:hypothetical protein